MSRFAECFMLGIFRTNMSFDWTVLSFCLMFKTRNSFFMPFNVPMSLTSEDFVWYCKFSSSISVLVLFSHSVSILLTWSVFKFSFNLLCFCRLIRSFAYLPVKILVPILGCYIEGFLCVSDALHSSGLIIRSSQISRGGILTYSGVWLEAPSHSYLVEKDYFLSPKSVLSENLQ